MWNYNKPFRTNFKYTSWIYCVAEDGNICWFIFKNYSGELIWSEHLWLPCVLVAWNFAPLHIQDHSSPLIARAARDQKLEYSLETRVFAVGDKKMIVQYILSHWTVNVFTNNIAGGVPIGNNAERIRFQIKGLDNVKL